MHVVRKPTKPTQQGLATRKKPLEQGGRGGYCGAGKNQEDRAWGAAIVEGLAAKSRKHAKIQGDVAAWGLETRRHDRATRRRHAPLTGEVQGLTWAWEWVEIVE